MVRKRHDTGIYMPRDVQRKMQFVKVDPDALYFIKFKEGSGVSQYDIENMKHALKGIGAHNVMVIVNDGIDVGEQGERQVSTEGRV